MIHYLNEPRFPCGPGDLLLSLENIQYFITSELNTLHTLSKGQYVIVISEPEWEPSDSGLNGILHIEVLQKNIKFEISFISVRKHLDKTFASKFRKIS